MKRLCLQLVVLFFLVAVSFGWQTNSAAKTDEPNLTVTPSFKADETLAPDSAIALSLSRALQIGETIGVLIEKTDVTALFSSQETTLRYNAGLLPLPIGKSNVTIYLVKNESWKELSRFTLLVKEVKSSEPQPAPANVEKPDEPITKTETASAVEKTAGAVEKTTNTVEKTAEPSTPDKPVAETTTPEKPRAETTTTPPEATPQPTLAKAHPFGFEKLAFLPTITLGLKAQPFQSNFPFGTRPAERATFHDFTMTASAKNEVKRGAFGLDSNFDFAGSSNKQEALQFGTLGEDAPQVDLSSYVLNVNIGKAKLAFGHTSFGSNRHLVNSFSSRGISLNIPINKRFDLTAGFMNGTSLLGFGNFTGLSKTRHQVQGLTLGIEFFPKRQNAMRLEITGFNGYVQPLNNVGEARINDAERSRGGGLRFITSDKSERFKLEAGFALSRFQNPQDTTLDPDGNAVPIAPVSRSAHYLDASYQILKDVSFVKDRKINLSFTFRHELVEPLYKSLGASAGADKTAQDYALEGSIGDITLAFAHARFNDNLRDVPSILKSLTRANRFAVGVATATLFGKPDNPSPLLPRLSYSFDQTHQFGAGIPINGGFEIDPSAIPDLVNTNQSVSSAWQFKKFNFEYRYNRSFADNRQIARETSDQLGYVHGFAVGLNPLSILSFTVGLNFENAHNFELDQTNRTKALTLGGTWQPFKGATFGGNLSHTIAGDAAKTNRTQNTNYDFQFAYNFSMEKSKFRKVGMQAFLRYADTLTRNVQFLFDVNDLTKTRIISAGLTFNFF